MSTTKTYRITLFKIPNLDDQQKLLDIYRSMPQRALKDGKPYIVSVVAGQATDDSRAQGYTVAVVTTFTSEEDFHYYDTQCPAHAELKSFARTINQGMMMVYYQAAF